MRKILYRTPFFAPINNISFIMGRKKKIDWKNENCLPLEDGFLSQFVFASGIVRRRSYFTFFKLFINCRRIILIQNFPRRQHWGIEGDEEWRLRYSMFHEEKKFNWKFFRDLGNFGRNLLFGQLSGQIIPSLNSESKNMKNWSKINENYTAEQFLTF